MMILVPLAFLGAVWGAGAAQAALGAPALPWWWAIVPFATGAAALAVSRRPASLAVALASLALAAGLLRVAPAGHGKDATLPSALARRLEAGPVVALRGEIAEAPVQRERAQRLRLRLEALRGADGTWEPASGVVQAVVRPAPQLRAGERLELRGDVRPVGAVFAGSYLGALRRAGVDGATSFPDVIRLGLSPGAPAWRLALERVRASLAAGLEALLPEPEASLVAGILLGRRAALPAELQEALARSGTSHLVAVSGYNVGLVVATAASVAAALVGEQRVRGGAPSTASQAGVPLGAPSTAPHSGALSDVPSGPPGTAPHGSAPHSAPHGGALSVVPSGAPSAAPLWGVPPGAPSASLAWLEPAGGSAPAAQAASFAWRGTAGGSAPVAVGATVALWGFVLLVGASGSVLRAAAMAQLAIVGHASGRRGAPGALLLWGSALLAAWEPALIHDAGWQLSFLGTAGLVWLAPAIAALFAPLPLALREGLGATLAAQLFVLPALATTFGQLSLVAPLANLLALPLVGPIMLGGSVTATAAVLCPPVAPLLAALTWVPATALRRAVIWTANLPGAAVDLPPWPPGVVAAYIAALVLLCAALQRWAESDATRRLATAAATARAAQRSPSLQTAASPLPGAARQPPVLLPPGSTSQLNASPPPSNPLGPAALNLSTPRCAALGPADTGSVALNPTTPRSAALAPAVPLPAPLDLSTSWPAGPWSASTARSTAFGPAALGPATVGPATVGPPRTALITGALLALAVVGCAMAAPHRPASGTPTLHLFVPAVPSGSLALLQAPGGVRVLLDGGPGTGAAAALLGAHLRPWDRTVDAVVLTDAADGHTTGLPRVLERYRPALLLDALDPSVPLRGAGLAETLAVARHAGVPRRTLPPGSTVSIGRGLRLATLPAATSSPAPGPPAPGPSAAGPPTASPDGASLTRVPTGSPAGAHDAATPAWYLTWGGIRLLVPGGDPARRWPALLANGLPAADVLLLTERAAADPAALGLVRAASPALVVVQGEPRPALLHLSNPPAPPASTLPSSPPSPPGAPHPPGTSTHLGSSARLDVLPPPERAARTPPRWYHTAREGPLRLEIRAGAYRLNGGPWQGLANGAP